MTITREQVIRDLAEATSYYQKDIKRLLSALDDLVEEYFAEVSDDNDVSVQLVRGCKIGAKVVPQRERVNPQDLSPVIVKATVKPSAKFSDVFRGVIQRQYEDNKSE